MKLRDGTNRKAFEREEAIAQIIQLRKAGMTQREISRQTGRSLSWVNQQLQKALADYTKATASDVEEMRATESIRLDAALRAIWPQVLRGNQGAIDRMIRIGERRARLYGFDAPSKIAPTDPSGAAEYSGGGLSALLRQVPEHGSGGAS
jgi:hypothetical protein